MPSLASFDHVNIIPSLDFKTPFIPPLCAYITLWSSFSTKTFLSIYKNINSPSSQPQAIQRSFILKMQLIFPPFCTLKLLFFIAFACAKSTLPYANIFYYATILLSFKKDDNYPYPIYYSYSSSSRLICFISSYLGPGTFPFFINSFFFYI